MNKVYDDIYNVQKLELDDSMPLKAMSLYRKQSNWLRELKYSVERDTVFLLEHSGIQGDYFFVVWNQIDTVFYTNTTGEFKPTDKLLFTKYMMKLVSEWNIPEIKREENTNSGLLPSEFVYATRIIIKNGKYKIDCIRFKEFFNLQRDGRDFY
jgi:hypothetical protein